ncbi:PKD domain-containing protein [Fluviicola taffensis]|uniref:PKD domain-containing protein n=1 Tax=Fluviicola taffensis TaxID=191579 RepID=UPI00313821C5
MTIHIMSSSVYSIFHFSTLTKQLLVLIFLSSFGTLSAQVTVGFQGGEPGDPWGFTSTGASALSISEATQSPNKVTGTTSLVVGGNTAGGNCFATGSGNGPNTARTFTFNALDITSSNASTRSLTFNWGNRYPACSGTGWDSGENLTFRAYHDGVAQAAVTLATGNNNAQFSILSNSYTWSVPPCVNQFYFVVSVTTNRADELLFLDNVTMTAPQLNGSLVTSPISGNTSVCIGASENYSVTPETGISYTWSGLPTGASFTTANGTTASSTIGVNWGTTPSGTYTLTVTPTNACGVIGTPQTISVTILPAPTPVTISGPTSMCSGDIVTLTSSYSSGNTWSPGGLTVSGISITTPGTYTVSTMTSCGIVTASHTVTLDPVPTVQSVTNTPVSCFGASDGSLTINSSDPNVEYSLDGITWQTANLFSNLAAGTYTPRVRFVGGCSTTLAPVQLTEPAVVTASASNTGTYCEGSTVFLHGTTSSTGTPTFSWSGPNGYTSTLQDPTDIPQTGTHTYQLIVSINGCQSSPATTTVTINPIPVASVSNTGPYCMGDAINLNGSTTSTGTVTYSWTGPNGYTSGIQNPSDATEAGTYQLLISENGCQSTPVSTTVIINPIPVAQASYVAPFCNGTSLQLNGTTTSTGTVNYSWTGPNSYISNQQNPSDATIAGTYTLIVTESGCPSIPATVTVVSQIPDAAASNTGPYCNGAVVFLHGTTSSAGTPTFSWSGPNGYASALQDPTDIPQTGTHTYQLIVSINGCQSAPVTTSVTINPIPVASVSNTGPYCTGDVIHLTSSTSSSAVTYSWTGPNSFTSSVQNPSSATLAGTYQLVISSNGCQSTPASTTVVMNTIPVAQASYIAPFCPGMPLQLNGSTTSTGTVTYQWTGPTGYTSTLQNPSDATTAGTYTLVVTESGCSSIPSSVVVISQIPSANASNTGPYCEGIAVQLNGSTSSAGAVSYSWVGPNGYSSTLQNPSNATLAGTYTLTVNEGGCTNTASTNVIVNLNPVAGFSSSAPCMNDSVAFLSLSSVPSPEIITNWNWDFNDGFISSEQNPKHIFGNTGTQPVTLKVTTASNCSNTVTQNIEVKPAIEADFHFSPSTVSISDPTVHFVNSSSNATTYLWDFGFEDMQSTELSPEFTFPSQPGSYSVKLVVYNEEGCKDSITKILSVKDEMIYYVPNAFTPDGDEFNQTFKPVFSSGFDPQNYTFLIYNRWGETIFESHDSTIGWDGTYQGEMVVEGTYIWNITVKQLHSDAFETFSGHVSLVR